jgi:hypothetical protein
MVAPAVLLALVACSQATPTAVVTSTRKLIEIPVTVEITHIVEREVPITVEVTRIVIATPIPFAPQTPSATENIGELTGTYDWMESNIEGRGCTLKVVHHTTLDPFNKIDFELSCNRGAPSFNSGFAQGTISEGKNVAAFTRYDPVSGETCNLVFRFIEAAVEVTQIGMDYACGFGHGVYAEGTYELVDSSIPQLGCSDLNTASCP